MSGTNLAPLFFHILSVATLSSQRELCFLSVASPHEKRQLHIQYVAASVHKDEGMRSISIVRFRWGNRHFSRL